MDPATILMMIELATKLAAMAQSAIERGRERGEWSPEQEEAFNQKRLQLTSQDHWKSRPLPGA